MINQKTLIILIVSFVYLAAAGGSLWWVVSQTKELGNRMQGQLEVIANAIAQEQQFIELNELIESSEPMRSSLDSLILTEGRTIDFLAQIEKVGSEQGVNLETLSLEVKETDEVFDNLIVNFKVVGSPDRVENMMGILEALPYHSELQNVKFVNSQEDGVTTMNVTLSVSLLTS